MKLIAAKYFPIGGLQDPLSMISSMYWGHFLADRFNLLNGYSPFNIAHIPGDLPNQDQALPFKTIMDTKAQELLNIRKDAPMAVSWSGGVDSTAVICALLRNGLPPKDLRVHCVNASIEEYPLFHQWLVDQGIPVIVSDTKKYLDILAGTDAQYVLSGWCADQLFGSNIHQRNPNLYYRRWDDSLRGLLKGTFPIAVVDRNIEIWDAYAKRLGFSLELFCEVAWLFNFTLKWTHVSRDFGLSTVSNSARRKMVAFFDDVRFQNWAVANYPRLRESHPVLETQYYKRELKEYIYEFNDDPTYFKHKGKRNSWANIGIYFQGAQFISVCDETGFKYFRAPAYLNNPHPVSNLRMVAMRPYLKEVGNA